MSHFVTLLTKGTLIKVNKLQKSTCGKSNFIDVPDFYLNFGVSFSSTESYGYQITIKFQSQMYQITVIVSIDSLSKQEAYMKFIPCTEITNLVSQFVLHTMCVIFVLFSKNHFILMLGYSS